MPKRKVSGRALVLAFLTILGVIGYLSVGQSAMKSSDPIGAAVAGAISPGLLLGALALFLAFLVGVIALALRSGRSVRLDRSGVSIGRKRR